MTILPTPLLTLSCLLSSMNVALRALFELTDSSARIGIREGVA